MKEITAHDGLAKSKKQKKSRDKPPVSMCLWISKTFKRTLVSKIIFISSLIVAAVACASVSYFVIKDLEVAVGEQTYESVAVSALEGATANIRRKIQGAEAMATIMSLNFPDSTTWPFVSLAGYTEINKAVSEMSASTEHAFGPLVQAEQIEEFESFMKEVYAKEGFPDYTGTSEFGFGIWKRDPYSPYEDGRVRDTGTMNYESNYNILAPLVHVAHKQSKFLMYNLKSSEALGLYVDSMLQCAEEARAKNASSSMPPCTVITDMTKMLHRDGPAGHIRTPIYPKNDPNAVVGIISTTVFWEDIFKNVVPDYVNGLMCVISTDTQTFTFEIQHGSPILLGSGDLHDAAFDEFVRSVVLYDDETHAKASKAYTLKVYPSDAIFNAFLTQSPLAVSLGFVGVIAVCTAIFLLYDFLMRYEVHQRAALLKIKRRFMRFISHEIRTPLNTICLGLELLSLELAATEDEESKASEEGDLSDAEKTETTSCQQITSEIAENAQYAVEVLNDLLNYDKIESGTLKLEIDEVSIWELISKTIQQFQVQAVTRKIDMNLAIHPPQREGGKVDDVEADARRSNIPIVCERLKVIGDDVRLEQVLRNVISNAVKFTPPDGKIQITASHIPNGLPNAKPITIDGSDIAHPLTMDITRYGSIRIEVKDSGVGMTSDQLKLLFSEGIQFDANKLQHGGGSGLGLNIAKGIVEQHRGSIIAESEGSGDGTTFIIDLPLYEFHQGANEVASSSTGTETTEFFAQTHKYDDSKQRERRILVVEDVQSSRKMLVRLLERSGHSCATAANGEMAVRAVAGDMAAMENDKDGHVPFDTILMDFEMPVLDGPDATERIRQMGFSRAIFGVTGNMLQEDIDYFKSKGADEVLPKPISLETLKNNWTRYPRNHIRKVP